jgi:hypothetical protein
MGETRARSHGEKLQRAEEEGRTLQGRQVQGAEGQPWGRGELAGEIAMAAARGTRSRGRRGSWSREGGTAAR